jgi:hypothetical protein
VRLAEQIWAERAGATPPGLELTGDLGAAVRRRPGHVAWSKIKLAIYNEDLSAEGKKSLKADQAANPALQAFDAYENWHDDIDAGDWLLDFQLNDNESAFGGYWSVPNPKLENELLTYVQERPCVALPGFGMLELSANDLSALKLAVPALLRTKKIGSPAMVPIRDAISFTDRRKNIDAAAPDLKSFERAMLHIYKEAGKIGYWPNEFLRMLELDGALPTAKRLIMSSAPSSGFTRLWELNRLDLTVEAIALRKPWRLLFTEVELERAQRRLRQYGFEE